MSIKSSFVYALSLTLGKGCGCVSALFRLSARSACKLLVNYINATASSGSLPQLRPEGRHRYRYLNLPPAAATATATLAHDQW